VGGIHVLGGDVELNVTPVATGVELELSPSLLTTLQVDVVSIGDLVATVCKITLSVKQFLLQVYTIQQVN